MLDTVGTRIDTALEDDADRGVFRVARDIFTDPEIFELEMKTIFEGNWIYLAHESQVANPNDYFTTTMGRQPIIISRDKAGQLNAFINACSHRGAMLCRFKRGNKATYTCPFHGWTFSNQGKLLKVKDPRDAGYPAAFDCDGSHNLTRVPRFESYRGFLFGSLNPDVAPLSEFLGEAAKMIDLMVDQSPEGLEVLRGASTYVYDGNWKLQTENGADGYHVTATHWNYAATTSRRAETEKGDSVRAMSAGGWAKQGGGFYSFENGHLVLWIELAEPRGPAELGAPRGAGGRVRGGARALDGAPLAQPLSLPERVPDGPVLDADPALPPDLRRQDRGHDLLHRAPGRGPGAARPPHPPVRGLLQRLRHGDPRRPRGIPRLPDVLSRPGRALERHVPRRRALDPRSRRGRRGASA